MKAKLIILILSLLLVISLFVNFLFYKKQNIYLSFDKSLSPTPTQTIKTPPTPIPTISVRAVKKTVIGKSITIPIKDSQGNTVNELKYTLDDYEITDEIIVNGKKANAVKGRAFLIVNITIDNPLGNSIQVNTRDYIRLSVNESENWVAPDIHNDPVEIQPIAGKVTRLGFPINEDDSNFSLQIGELNGQKEVINLE
ncbi:hypothetical protein A2865_01450 [Candidatus Woesebacteria bacterium RIFCSPHIGHO2_01_FULL_39_17]|uniref:DUF4352 domain-containing protein n=3 Tax=Candidatus Woeseibacteriota TaxID=1752722 RepID=A0A0G0NDC2_9BACT|nr:MAG: hypothetical protein US72_C0014G0046 [Microgenomates group bacterium GW2011_GWC1_38_12]KKQ93561.1 MAG: hypothetical protein UT19_C0010G0005 [Candidatus Woesebacteria bacterium GW2011_GWB1_39_10b]KKR13508.1 MAG: hypothetical protein UT40_C0015G0005 [Candidatus Woesebacteria bacterium GW2011_GWA1_39_21b]OGM22863.1 MAG: hypothetical protein A2865_01450 [Candidatus Woesebacteria bacterium RIFCSPHIGHO2_01_FULL_39_17]OGM61916.1 MAG: hypothetical protein A3A52_00020 [Candidatus Woesebacteria b